MNLLKLVSNSVISKKPRDLDCFFLAAKVETGADDAEAWAEFSRDARLMSLFSRALSGSWKAWRVRQGGLHGDTPKGTRSCLDRFWIMWV